MSWWNWGCRRGNCVGVSACEWAAADGVCGGVMVDEGFVD